jgi:hypothetical protein
MNWGYTEILEEVEKAVVNKQDIKYIQEKLSVLVDQPLRHISRGGGSIFIGFGELVKHDAMYFTESGKASRKKEMISRYALHIECSSRFVCGDKIVMAKYEVYQPTSEQTANADFDWDSFNWDVRGGNRYDELVSKYFTAIYGRESFGK